MSHIYVTSKGSKMGIDGGRVVIEQKDGGINSIPQNSIESVSIFDNTNSVYEEELIFI